MRTSLYGSMLSALVLTGAGCQEYFTVDEACHPDGKFSGMSIDTLQPGEVSAIDRMNCYRRLIKFRRYGVDEGLQQAGENMASYVVQNPDIYGRSQSATSYLVQEGARPGFSGTEIWERLNASDYFIADATSIRVEQIIGIYPYEVSGPAVIDDLMRTHWMQETILTPSAYHVSYVEASLDTAWWQSTGLDPVADGPLPERGTLVYAAVASEMPPNEGAGTKPVVFPKRNMEGVPLSGPLVYDRYIPDVNADGEVTEADATRLSYPLTLGYTSTLPGTSGASPFGLVILSATIDGPDGPMETIWASPEDPEPANHRFDTVTGSNSYWAGGTLGCNGAH